MNKPSLLTTKVASPSFDAAINLIASRQHGRITTAQLTEIGLSSAGIRHRVMRGQLVPVHRGVYAVGHSAPSRVGDLMAAVLAAGPDAALSHAVAVEVRGAWPYRTPELIDVTSPASRRDHAGVRVRQSRTFGPADIVLVDGIPVTSIPRTLLDLGDVLTPYQVAHVLHRLLYDHEVHLYDLRVMAERGTGRRAGRTLRTAIDLHVSGSAGVRSELEQRWVELVQRQPIVMPLVNVWVRVVRGAVALEPRRGRRARPSGVWELDTYWPAQGVNVEVDGGQHHDRRESKRTDRERDEALGRAGLNVVRIGARHIQRAERYGGLPRPVARALSGGWECAEAPYVPRV
ncbi:MAG: hypothetical protein JWO69_1391 [Thermoleophilia bacterium]|nr:hypothetical protein [Thermoleophilia bacterium]